MMAPFVHGLAAKYTDRMVFTYLDIDDPANKNTLKDFGYRVQPEYYLLDKNGAVLKKWVGFVDPKDFEVAFQEALKIE